MAYQSASTQKTTTKKEENDFLTVYRKKSTFKGATDTDFWYSATLSDGKSAILKFDNSLEIPDLPAFAVKDIKGQAKHKPVYSEENPEEIIYDNMVYYIKECKFLEIPSVDLPL